MKEISERIKVETLFDYEDTDFKRTTNSLSVEIHFSSDVTKEQALAWLEQSLESMPSDSFLRVEADLFITPKEDN